MATVEGLHESAYLIAVPDVATLEDGEGDVPGVYVVCAVGYIYVFLPLD